MNNIASSYMRAKNKNWYSLKAFKEGDKNVAVLSIDDAIDPVFGLDANALAANIRALEADEIKIFINSPGGDVFSGMSLYNALKAHPATVKTYNTGLAASIASVIMLAGDEIYTYENALTMIHNAYCGAIGSATELRNTANVLDKIDDQIVGIYQKATGVDKIIIEEMMAKETWFNSAEAREIGFSETIEDKTAKTQMAFDLSVFRNTPDEIKNITNKDTMEAAKKELDIKKHRDERNEMERRIRLSVAMDNI